MDSATYVRRDFQMSTKIDVEAPDPLEPYPTSHNRPSPSTERVLDAACEHCPLHLTAQSLFALKKLFSFFIALL